LLLGEIWPVKKKGCKLKTTKKKSINNIQQQQHAFCVCITLGLQTTWDKYEVLLQMYWATLGNLLGT